MNNIAHVGPQTGNEVACDLTRTLALFPPPSDVDILMGKPLLVPDQKTREAIMRLYRCSYASGELKYSSLARLLACRLLKTPDLSDAASHIEHFCNGLIFLLRTMPIDKCVSAEVEKDMNSFMQKYGDSIQKLLIWSAGDEEAGGQSARFLNTGIPQSMLDICARKPEWQEKLGWFIRAKKLDALEAYLKHLLTTQEEVNLVVIEDDINRINEVKEMIARNNWPRKVHFTSIYASYAAKGRKDRTSCVGEIFVSESIHSLAELMKDRFNVVFDNAIVLCDKDGVLVENGENPPATMSFHTLKKRRRTGMGLHLPLAADEYLISSRDLRARTIMTVLTHYYMLFHHCEERTAIENLRTNAHSFLNSPT